MQARRQRGVTLIELLIALAIAAILIAMGVPSFLTFLRNAQVRNAAESIQNGISLAKTEAVRRNTNVQIVFGTDASWTVGCVAPSATCPATIQDHAESEGAKRAVITKSDTTLAFDGLGKINPTTLALVNTSVFDISNPTGGGTCAAVGGDVRCLRVVVSSAGQVRMCDPKLAASDPRGCP